MDVLFINMERIGNLCLYFIPSLTESGRRTRLKIREHLMMAKFEPNQNQEWVNKVLPIKLWPNSERKSYGQPNL